MVHALPGALTLRVRRTSGWVLGIAGLVLSAGLLFLAIGFAVTAQFEGLACLTVLGLTFGFAGKRALTGGALILDVRDDGTQVAALARMLFDAELKRVEVRVSAKTRVEIFFSLAQQTMPLSLTDAPVRCRDPDALARQLSSVLKVPVDVSR